MPFHKKIYNHGNLIVQFKIKFPTHLDQKSMSLLSEALGDSKQTTKAGVAGKKGGEE
jgi:DnaJ-class molecular chaperone